MDLKTEKKLFKKFLKRLEKKEKIEFIYVTCPYLEGTKCTIYEERMHCCRTFPNKDGICVDYECNLKDYVRNDSHYDVCKDCSNNCCKRISYPKDVEFDVNFLKDILNVDCETCAKLYKDYEWDFKAE